jgi:transposase-like protein
VGLTNIVSDEEVAAYEKVRHALRSLARQYPGLLEIPIADGQRRCPICNAKTVVELPETGRHEEAFTCRTCERSWTARQADSQSWVKLERAHWRESRRDAAHPD